MGRRLRARPMEHDHLGCWTNGYLGDFGIREAEMSAVLTVYKWHMKGKNFSGIRLEFLGNFEPLFPLFHYILITCWKDIWNKRELRLQSTETLNETLKIQRLIHNVSQPKTWKQNKDFKQTRSPYLQYVLHAYTVSWQKQSLCDGFLNPWHLNNL